MQAESGHIELKPEGEVRQGSMAERPRYAAFFILGVFFILPITVILVMQLFV